MSTPPDLQPEVDVVLQEEHYDPSAVKVCVESVLSPVRTQDLPRKAGATRTRPVTTTAIKVLAADDYRAQAVVVAFAQDVYLAFSAAASGDTSRMSRWPALVPYVHTASTELWVQAFQATTDVSITTELWATGD